MNCTAMMPPKKKKKSIWSKIGATLKGLVEDVVTVPVALVKDIEKNL